MKQYAPIKEGKVREIYDVDDNKRYCEKPYDYY